MEKGNEIIRDSGLNLLSELDFETAARKACSLLQK